MGKNVFIISSSPRKGGNSEILADEFGRGAVEAGNFVDKICLYDKNISFCKGCFACLKTHKCIINDDVDDILHRMKESDVLVFATPVYYYSISGQLKTMFDRTNPLFTSDYKFRDVYLLATAAEDEETTFEGTEKAVQGWINCFDKAKLSGVVFGGGVNSKGEVNYNNVLLDAYKMGKTV